VSTRTPSVSRFLVEVEAEVGRDVEHPVVGGDQEGGVVGQSGDELLDDPVDEGQLRPPAGRVDAADVAGEVELGDVAVHEGSGGRRQRAQRQRAQVAVADRPGVGGTAVDGAGQAGAGVGIRADGCRGDSGGHGLLEHGAPRLPGVRIGVVGPLDVVEGAVRPRDVGDESEDAVAARRQAGAERGQADRSGARARCGQVADRCHEAGERGREVSVGAHQVGPEAVDEQDQHPPRPSQGRGDVERIDREVTALNRDTEGRGGAGEHVGQGGGAVGRHRQVRRQRGHGRVARTCRPVAMSR
jgi:hypothetical protein